MQTKQSSVFENGVLWFGAAVSMAEILTGTYLAPLGWLRGLAAIFLGHLIGCSFLFLVGLIGAKSKKSAMETVKMSFGKKGSLLFAVLNILQLAGWVGIMIYDGAAAANGIFPLGTKIFCLLIGGLLLVWIWIGRGALEKVNTLAMTALFLLTLLLSVKIFLNPAAESLTENPISFGAAVELSVAMPLSWLPLISDYTREAKKGVKATAVSAIVYGIVSSWMYVIGMGMVIFTGESDIAQMLVKIGLGAAGLLIILFSTVTTAFLDAYSAGISAESISKKCNGKRLAIVFIILGMLGAMFLPLGDITSFLYFIGSVFAPMTAIQIVDYYLLKKDVQKQNMELSNLCIWFFGFCMYRISMRMDSWIGNTFPAMLLTGSVCILVNLYKKKYKKS